MVATLPVTLYDRPRLAAQNLMRADFGAAARSVFAPDTLTPKELKEMADKYKDHPIMGAIARTATNPLFIIGAILALKYPVPKLAELFKVAPKFGPMAKSMGRVKMWMSGPTSVFGDTVGGLMGRIAERAHQVKVTYLEGHMEGAVNKYMAAHGGKAPSSHFFDTYAFKAGGWDKYASEGNTALRKAMAADGVKFDGALMKTIHYSKGEQSLYDKVRGVFKKFWDTEWKGNPEGTKLARKEIHRRGWGMGDEVVDYWPRKYGTSSGETGLTLGIPDPIRGQEYVERIRAPLSKSSLVRATQLHGLPDLTMVEKLNAQGRVTPGAWDAIQKWKTARHAHVRGLANQYLSDPKALESSEVANWLKERFQSTGMKYDAAEASINGFVQFGRMGEKARAMQLFDKIVTPPTVIPQFNVNFARGVSDYFNTMASQVAFTHTGWGAQLQAAVHTLDPIRRELLVNKYLPILRGQKTAEQMQQAISYGQKKMKWLDFLNKPGVKKWVPAKSHKFMTDALSVGPGGMSKGSPAASVASYFYLSTLGINPGPAMKNLMQTFITTDPLIGIKWKVRALKHITPMVRKYAELRAGGVTDVVAMQKAFPEFHAAGMELAPLSSGFISGMAGGASEVGGFLSHLGRGGKVAGGIETVKKTMMAGFTASERFNRVMSFYGPKLKGISEGLTTAQWMPLAKQVVERTQFPSGIMNTPSGLLNLPPYARQFMHFPLKMVEFLTESPKWGSAASGKKQWGTLGRALMGGTALYEGSKGAGVNMEQGLLFGALPLPTWESTPFYPFPLVPPAFSIAGSVASAVATGDYKRLGQAGALMVPGGVAARRAYRSLAPKFADYQNRQPDGRIPVYSDNKLLIGSYKPLQLVGKAMGLKSVDEVTEQGMVAYFLKQRDRIRDYRRKYMDALYRNETGTAQKISKEFAKKYPELGPLQVKKSDIRGQDQRRTVTRLNRILKGFPKEYRPLFQDMVNSSVSERMVSDLESMPLRSAARRWGAEEPRGLNLLSNIGNQQGFLGVQNPYGTPLSNNFSY